MNDIKGFEVRLNKTREGQCLYITNRLVSGKISLIIAEEKPSVGDVQHTAMRWDVSEDRFDDLWNRVNHKIHKPEEEYTVTEPEEVPEIEEAREETIEIPEVIETPEKAVRRPRGRRPRVPRPVLQ